TVEGKSYDAGFIIQDRLEKIAETSNLKINTYYLQDIDHINFTFNNAEDLRKYHNADIVIFGNLVTQDCSSRGNQICLNYQLDERYYMDQKQKNNYVKGNVDDLKEGYVQNELEEIIFILTTLSQIGYSQDSNLAKYIKSRISESASFSDFQIYVEVAD